MIAKLKERHVGKVLSLVKKNTHNEGCSKNSESSYFGMYGMPNVYHGVKQAPPVFKHYGYHMTTVLFSSNLSLFLPPPSLPLSPSFPLTSTNDAHKYNSGLSIYSLEIKIMLTTKCI